MSARDRDAVDPALARLHAEVMATLGLPQAPRPLTDAEIVARLRTPESTPGAPTCPTST